MDELHLAFSKGSEGSFLRRIIEQTNETQLREDRQPFPSVPVLNYVQIEITQSRYPITFLVGGMGAPQVWGIQALPRRLFLKPACCAATENSWHLRYNARKLIIFPIISSFFFTHLISVFLERLVIRNLIQVVRNFHSLVTLCT